MWQTITPKALGFPCFPVESVPTIAGSVLPWITGMRVCADWHIIQMHSGNIRSYQAAGGLMERAIISHFSNDAGIINPLWGKQSFLKRVERMKKLSIKTVIAPDFSSWADMPIVQQLYNYYRSLVVARDLTLAGFAVIPLVCWSAPQIAEISITAWPAEAPTMIVDGSHAQTVRQDFNEELFWSGAKIFREKMKPSKLLLWARSERIGKEWQRTIGPCQYVMNRTAMMAKFSDLKGRKNEHTINN